MGAASRWVRRHLRRPRPGRPQPPPAPGDAELPQILASPQVVPPADPLARPGPREELEPLAAHAGARREVGEVGVRAAAPALFDERPGVALPQAGYVTQADPDREGDR